MDIFYKNIAQKLILFSIHNIYATYRPDGITTWNINIVLLQITYINSLANNGEIRLSIFANYYLSGKKAR